MNSGPAVRRTDADIVATTVNDAAAGKLAQTVARCQAALAAAEESVQRAEAALATAEERLRRAQDVQTRFRELRQRTGGMSTVHSTRPALPIAGT